MDRAPKIICQMPFACQAHLEKVVNWCTKIALTITPIVYIEIVVQMTASHGAGISVYGRPFGPFWQHL